MLILVFLLAIAILCFCISQKIWLDDIWEVMLLLTGFIAGFFFLLLSIMALVVHSDYVKEKELTKFEENYKAIIYSCNSDSENVVALTQEIAEYNTAVLNGRLAMDNSWLSFFEYDFYYELPLIDISMKDEVTE